MQAPIRLSFLLLLGSLLIASCARKAEEVVIYTSVDQVFSEPVFRLFDERTGIKVRAVFDTEETKSTGVMNRLIAEAANPQADVYWSNDPIRPFTLIQRQLVAFYHSPNAKSVAAQFKSPDGLWTGLAARARVLIVNREKLGARSIPQSITDLTKPEWRADAAIANPLYGTTTTHVAALFSHWGDVRAEVYFQALKENQVRIASSNGEVKRLVASGEVAIGLADTDDAFEAVEINPLCVVIYPDQDSLGALILPTMVVAIAKSNSPSPAAQSLMDFLLTPEVEGMLAESAHMPLHPGVKTPQGMKRLDEVRAMQVDYKEVARRMEQLQPWLREWTGM